MLIRSLVTVMSHEEPVYSAGRNGWNVHGLVVQLDKPERQQCAESTSSQKENERLLSGSRPPGLAWLLRLTTQSRLISAD